MTIGPNDPINDDWQTRAEGLIDAKITIEEENSRTDSPLNAKIDVLSMAVAGYSMGGGAAQAAALLDPALKAIIALHPTLAFQDPITEQYSLNQDDLIHQVPVLIITGETEGEEFENNPSWGNDHYFMTPETTQKMLIEIENGTHDSASYPNGFGGQAGIKTDLWLDYFLLENPSSCEPLVTPPNATSQFLTTIDCTNSTAGDINQDEIVNVLDIIHAISLILTNTFDALADLNQDNQLSAQDIQLLIHLITD